MLLLWRLGNNCIFSLWTIYVTWSLWMSFKDCTIFHIKKWCSWFYFLRIVHSIKASHIFSIMRWTFWTWCSRGSLQSKWSSNWLPSNQRYVFLLSGYNAVMSERLCPRPVMFNPSALLSSPPLSVWLGLLCGPLEWVWCSGGDWQRSRHHSESGRPPAFLSSVWPSLFLIFSHLC